MNCLRIWTGVLQEEGEKFAEFACQKKAEELATAKAKRARPRLMLPTSQRTWSQRSSLLRHRETESQKPSLTRVG